MPLPLDGLLVLDFSTLLPGPLATLMLAEAGAEVVKVERPGGEDMRAFPPASGDISAPFAVLNAGKTSLFVDLKSPAGRAALDPYLKRADILVEQFRPGVMDRLGLGYEAAAALNPGLIYCSISGYGQAGPRAGEAGHDINYQARSGLLSLAPGVPGAPATPAALVADIGGGSMPAVLNILLALRQRDRTGKGTYLDIAMTDALFTFAWYGLAEGFATGAFPGPGENRLAGGSPRYGLYDTADGRFVAVGALEEKFWRAFCEGIGLPSDLRDDSCDPAATRVAIAAILRAEPAAAWSARLEPLDCCCCVVASLQEALADPHFRARGLWAARADAGRDGIPITPLPLAPALRRDATDFRRVAGVDDASRQDAVIP
ncbi:MAG TPA: CaiB/BaiF CoA-transferase family protein [Beijerinckiaceae bacterium]|jgi:crotonobetainyl-CoA:carnitine CoA-transferase CaiB-like acyl-CoA transferase